MLVPVRRWPSVKTTCTTTRLHVTDLAYRAYTHAHNTLTVGPPTGVVCKI